MSSSDITFWVTCNASNNEKQLNKIISLNKVIFCLIRTFILY